MHKTMWINIHNQKKYLNNVYVKCKLRDKWYTIRSNNQHVMPNLQLVACIAWGWGLEMYTFSCPGCPPRMKIGGFCVARRVGECRVPCVAHVIPCCKRRIYALNFLTFSLLNAYSKCSINLLVVLNARCNLQLHLNSPCRSVFQLYFKGLFSTHWTANSVGFSLNMVENPISTSLDE